MDSLITAFEIVFPAVVVGLIAFFIISRYLRYEETRQKFSIDKARLEIVIPARMQAYERVILFLERTQPESLVRRILRSNTSARSFQTDLVSAVRSEYEHNISQQIYVSLAAWAMVKTATEETIRLINVAGSKIPANNLASELAERILEISSQIGKFPTHMAIEHIKKEFAQYFFQTNQTTIEE